MIKLYRHELSGHAHRVELFLSLLGLDHELVDVDLVNGEHKQEAFRALNPFGQVPVIDDDGTIVSDSNAILVYLAKKYGTATWLPEDAEGAARVTRWLSVAAGPVAFGPATARLITIFGAPLDAERAKTIAYGLFDVMEQELAGRDWLAGTAATIADIAGYSYIAHAPEGDVSLEPYPHIRAWLKRIEGLDGFVPMKATKVALAA
ncbi:glutathione S-transferase [Pyruvatibacter mobilis]|uniref:Glutathione S-transferase n=1 Tax=Pyruvatibacter mobilis TaxID=1712261 RepID=A0A845QA91_9HYPH|nr:glutathione S-transferase [Pyruvatibacter mobilis]NBG95208.1 glutathione S-transferase [Pyruvatibacter mobilis]QJD76387.1 glutathione S-transferase [Pyruvatibacter mobilis]GGD23614.1 glutathione S-transferase [Pyruvatibacter mobilis]